MFVHNPFNDPQRADDVDDLSWDDPVAQAEQPDKKLHAGTTSAYRTLRALQILSSKTDANLCMAASTLQRLLEQPEEPGATPVKSSEKSVYAAITSLRMAGYRIASRGTRGYAFLSRPLADADIRDLLRLVESSEMLSWERIQTLSLALVNIGSPSLRVAEERRRFQQQQNLGALPEATWDVNVAKLEDLVYMAQQFGCYLHIELGSADEPCVPVRFKPQKTMHRDGQAYVSGVARQSVDAPEVARTILCERIRTASLLVEGKLFSYKREATSNNALWDAAQAETFPRIDGFDDWEDESDETEATAPNEPEGKGAIDVEDEAA